MVMGSIPTSTVKGLLFEIFADLKTGRKITALKSHRIRNKKTNFENDIIYDYRVRTYDRGY